MTESTTAMEACWTGLQRFEHILEILDSPAKPNEQLRLFRDVQVAKPLLDFVLWLEDVEILYPPLSNMSLETRLDNENRRSLFFKTMGKLNESAGSLISSLEGKQEVDVSLTEQELFKGIITMVYQLFNEFDGAIPYAQPTDLFAEAQSLCSPKLDNQADIELVGKMFPKLKSEEHRVLRERLGDAITQRRRYLSYHQDAGFLLRKLLGEWESFEADPSVVSRIPQSTFANLRAYVCPDPECTLAPFWNVNKWYQHWSDEHAHEAKRVCPCCSDWDGVEQNEAVEASKENADSGVGFSNDALATHVAAHMERLALYAVPPDFHKSGFSSLKVRVVARNKKFALWELKEAREGLEDIAWDLD